MLSILPLFILGQTPESVDQLRSGMSGYAVGWGALALINAGLAQGKNRSGLNWFFVSVFLGPLATFLLVACYERLPPDMPAK